jgi:hypothetical protein
MIRLLPTVPTMNDGAVGDFGAGDDLGRFAGDVLDVIGEIVGGPEDPGQSLGINVDRRRGVRVHDVETAGSRRELDVLFLAQSPDTLRDQSGGGHGDGDNSSNPCRADGKYRRKHIRIWEWFKFNQRV